MLVSLLGSRAIGDGGSARGDGVDPGGVDGRDARGGLGSLVHVLAINGGRGRRGVHRGVNSHRGRANGRVDGGVNSNRRRVGRGVDWSVNSNRRRTRRGLDGNVDSGRGSGRRSVNRGVGRRVNGDRGRAGGRRGGVASVRSRRGAHDGGGARESGGLLLAAVAGLLGVLDAGAGLVPGAAEEGEVNVQAGVEGNKVNAGIDLGLQEDRVLATALGSVVDANLSQSLEEALVAAATGRGGDVAGSAAGGQGGRGAGGGRGAAADVESGVDVGQAEDVGTNVGVKEGRGRRARDEHGSRERTAVGHYGLWGFFGVLEN